MVIALLPCHPPPSYLPPSWMFSYFSSKKSCGAMIDYCLSCLLYYGPRLATISKSSNTNNNNNNNNNNKKIPNCHICKYGNYRIVAKAVN